MLTSSLWWIPLAAGVEDALNPCVLMICSMFIIYSLRLSNPNQPQRNLLLASFVVLVFLFTLIFNAGIAQGLLFSKMARIVIKVIYLLLGIVATIDGFIVLRDWRKLKKSGCVACTWIQQMALLPSLPGRIAWPITVLMALIFSALATIWPMNYNMTILSNNLILPGNFFPVLFLIALYSLVVLWPLYLVWYTAVNKNFSISILHSIYAAVFFAAGLGCLFIFK